MPRVKIKLADNITRVVFVETEATVGATIGTDLKLPSGQVATVAQLQALLGIQTGEPETVDHRLLAGLSLGDDHPQYTRKDTLTTRGDLYSRGATTVQRLALGTDRQFFRAGTLDPAWETVSPTVTLGTDLSGNVTLTNLASGTLGATIVANAVTDTKLRDSAALSVIGRSVNTLGDPADIAGTADQVLRVNTAGTVLGFGTVATGGLADDAVTDAKFRNSAALSVIGRGANSLGDPGDIAGTADQVLRVNTAGTALAFGTIATGGLAANAVTNAKLAQMVQATIKGRAAAAGTGDATDLTAAQVATIVNSSLDHGTLGGLADDDHTQYVLRSILTSNGDLFTRTAGVVDRLAIGTSLQLLRTVAGAPSWQTISPVLTLGADLSGNVTLTDLGNGTLNATVVSNAISDTKLRDSAALSVIGRSANSSGDPADIAGTDGQVLRVSGTTLGFGTIATAGLAANSVTNAKLAQMAQSTIKGRAEGAGTGDPVDLTPTQIAAIIDGEAITWSAAHIFTSSTNPSVQSASPGFSIYETDQVSGEQRWNWSVNGKTMSINATDNAGATTRALISANRGTASAITAMTFGNPTDNPTIDFDTNQFRITPSGATVELLFNTTRLEVRSGRSFRAGDTGNTDYIEVLHDGTDSLAQFTNTANWRIKNAIPLFLDSDNQALKIGAGTDLSISHDGTNTLLNNVTGEMRLQHSGTNQFRTGNGFSDMTTQARFTGEQRPSQFVANTDNFALNDVSVLYVSTDASRNLTGITGGTTNRLLFLINNGSQPLVLVHDATSTAANRFSLASATNTTIQAGGCCLLLYDGTASRWRQVTRAA